MVVVTDRILKAVTRQVCKRLPPEVEKLILSFANHANKAILDRCIKSITESKKGHMERISVIFPMYEFDHYTMPWVPAEDLARSKYNEGTRFVHRLMKPNNLSVRVCEFVLRAAEDFPVSVYWDANAEYRKYRERKAGLVRIPSIRTGSIRASARRIPNKTGSRNTTTNGPPRHHIVVCQRRQ